jgi:hypothetical protein
LLCHDEVAVREHDPHIDSLVRITGHQFGRPLFGARYCGQNEKCLVSWGVDGNLCLWDSFSQGNINTPLAVLKYDPEYPIYAVEVTKNCVAVGGGNEGGFVGVPLFLFSYEAEPPAQGTAKASSTSENTTEASNEEPEADPDTVAPAVQEGDAEVSDEKSKTTQ